MANSVGSSRRGVTRLGGLFLTIVGVVLLFAGGAMFAFVSADGLMTRLFPLLAVGGLVLAIVGVKNVFLPSARNRRTVGN